MTLVYLDCNSSSTASKYYSLWAFDWRLSLNVFVETCLLGRDLRTVTKNVSFPSPTDVRSHNSLPFKTQRSRCHSFPSPIDVGSHNPPLFKVQRPPLSNQCRVSHGWFQRAFEPNPITHQILNRKPNN